jgi:hypothetical protein
MVRKGMKWKDFGPISPDPMLQKVGGVFGRLN